MNQIQRLLSDGFAAFAEATTCCGSIAHAATDLCEKHTIYEVFCLAQHPLEGGKVNQWFHLYAEDLPQLIEETPSWVFGVCEAIKSIATSKTDLVSFCYEDGERERVGIDWLEEDGRLWRTLRWLGHNGIDSSIIRSGEGYEAPVMAVTIILSNLLRANRSKKPIQCSYVSKGDPTDPSMVAAAIAYKIISQQADDWVFRLTLYELFDAHLTWIAETSMERHLGFSRLAFY